VLVGAYFIGAHYFFLGFGTWDGLTYRIPPIVELLQHGSLGGWKFNYPAAQHFYPFFELVHLPFLKVMGLPGLYFSYSLVLLPASVAAVYAFVKELTGDKRWASYSALSYLAIPFVNAQAFSGYVDFAVIGALAFFLYALLKVLRSSSPASYELVMLSVATAVFSLSRQQAPYVASFVAVAFTAWFAQDGGSPGGHAKETRVSARPFLRTSIAFLAGIAPAAALHIYRFIEFGTPMYPYQLRVLMLSTSAGLTPEYTMAGAGLIEPTLRGMLQSFIRGWLWPSGMPGNFYDSRVLGVGLLFWAFIASLPLLGQMIKRDHRKVFVLFAVVALVGQDFWLPRWSMTLILTMIIGIGAALAWTASHGKTWAYFGLLVLVGLHLTRPAYDAYAMMQNREAYYRVNISNSATFIGAEWAPGELAMYPDLRADLLIVHPVINEFTLLLYGGELSNRIVGVLEPSQADDVCQGGITRSDRQLLIIDQTGKLAAPPSGCSWECVYEGSGLCLAGRLSSAE
jgi:hypothetical protein